MNYKAIKKELFFVRKAFFEYGRGFDYLLNKYRLAPRILKLNRILERPMNNKSLAMHVLSCHKDIVMLAWSLASFYINSSVIGQLYIHDDGTLTQADKKALTRFFPSSKIRDTGKFVSEFGSGLSAYPIIRAFRQKYVGYFSFKKIVDPFFSCSEPNILIFDSDVLWFRKPALLEREIGNGCPNSWMMKNNGEIYVSFKNGGKLADTLARFNAGIILFSRANLDLRALEEFFAKLDTERERNLHFADQAGFASALRNLEYLPEEDYIIKGALSEVTTVKHYTNPRRPLFYIEALPRLLPVIIAKS